MTNVITTNIYPKLNSQTAVNNEQQQNNFGAIDVNNIKQDTVEFAQKTGEQIKENWLFRMMRNTFGIENPKKFTISAVLTLATVVGCAVLGNKMSDKTAEFGLKVDEKILGKDGNSIFARIGKGLAKAKNRVFGFLKSHSKTVEDISDTMKNKMAKPKADLTRGYGRGFVSIFSLTPVDILNKAFAGQKAEYAKLAGNPAEQQKIAQQVKKSLSKLVGADSAEKFTSRILDAASEKLDNRKFCDEFSKAMRANFNCKSNKEFLAVLKKLKAGKLDGSELFTAVNMKDKGLTSFISSWWPVNLMRKFVSLFKKDTKFGTGNLGDSLIKFNAVNGTLADTALGKLAQKSITVPTESISNFVNDKSGLGVLLCSSVMSTYNNMQDAPKDEKVATVADSFVGTIGSIAIATPLAFKTTYGLASLANLEGKTLTTKLLKGVGKIFNMGLSEGAGKLARFGGGALRFALIMFVFNSLFSKPINYVIHKVFGTPGAQKEKEKLVQQQKELEQMKLVQQQPQAPSRDASSYSDTNLLKKWTQLPDDANKNLQNSQSTTVINNPNAAASLQKPNNSQPIKPQNQDEIAALNLFKKDNKQTDRYIPSIEPIVVPEEEDPQVNAKVNELLKKSDRLIDSSRKLL